MSSAGEKASLLSDDHEISESAKKLSDLQPCANFLLNSIEDTWYEGKIHKNNVNGVRANLEKLGLRNEYSKFISYKFVHEGRTFCITFRKETTVAGILNNLGGINNVFLIRLSLIEEDTNQTYNRGSGIESVSDETRIKCIGKESLILEPKSFPVGIKIPTEQNAEFSSITSGDTPDQIAIVRGMDKIPEGTPNKYEVFFKSHISPHMKTLGPLLVDNCARENTASQGGATRRHTRLTRRRKSVFKRKGKKSYRKKKYGKTKKSRRFRRSVRSRR
jgi:hypothetical protein